ncbi:alpha/beta fold hydrolase [Candidatus Lokiarchaeum ossiferum]|uniref:alpha/beta fold hydrolase n=1 Tax=Candidatus Lokiarchaeum ossiferum TaxID=2951803 RepID=UPI00352CF890
MNFETGLFLKKIPYAKAGSGSKKLIIFPPTHHLMWDVRVDAEEQIKGYSRFVPEGYTFYILGYDPNLPKMHTSESIAADFAEIIKNNIGPATIMAVSYGGSIAFPFAATYPELVEKLILIVTAYGTSGSGAEFAEQLVKLAKEGKIFTLERKINDLYSNTIIRKLFKLKMWKDWAKKESTMNPISTFINAYEHLLATSEERRKYLSQISAPTLIIGGTADQFASEEYYRTTADLIPNSHLELFEGETHTVIVEQFFAVKKLIRQFLEVDQNTIRIIKNLSQKLAEMIKENMSISKISQKLKQLTS